jgi:hypothetical protein
MAILNSTSALKARNHGSETEGIFDGSASPPCAADGVGSLAFHW